MPAVAATTVVISGAGSGIGRAAARLLAAEGHSVVAVGRRGEALAETASAAPERIRSCRVDVVDAGALATALADATTGLPPVGYCIAAAAQYARGHFLDMRPETFSAMIRANVEGVANLLRLILPGMIERRFGRIVVVGSLADMNPIPGAAGYSASKGALHALVRGIAGEIDPTRHPNVLINELSPGATRTAMSDRGKEPQDVFPDIRRLLHLPEGGPTGRFYLENREIRLGESWKQALRRRIGL